MVLALGTAFAGALIPIAPGSAAATRAGIDAISPLAGSPAGGNTLTIRGTALDRVTAVSFGAARSRKVTHTSDQLMSVVVPAHAVGAVRVRLVSPGGVGTDAARYRYAPAPVQLRWSRDHKIDAERGDLAGLSCPSAQFCVSVEAAWPDPSLLTFAPNGRARRTDLPKKQGIPAVSCVSDQRCFALLSNGTVSRWNGRTWSGFRPVAPARAFLRDLSCVPGVRFCLAVGGTGATWVYGPAGWSRAAKLHHETYEASLSCVSAQFCLLVTNGRAFRFDGTSWQGASRGLSAELRYGNSAATCVSPTFCLLVGEYETFRWDGSRWHGRYGGPNAYEPGLACASTHLCVLATDEGTMEWVDGVWQDVDPGGRSVEFPGASCPDETECLTTIRAGVAIRDASGWSTHYVERAGGDLTDVSCATAGWCMAVDGFGNAVGRVGGVWRHPDSVDGHRAISAVSCSSRRFCVAVDGADPYYRTKTPGVGRAVMYRHGRWRRPAVIDPDFGLTDVACASNRLCVAVDVAGDVVRWNGRRWSAPRRVGALFEAVACPTASYCVAVGRHSAEWRSGRWRPIENPAGSRQLTDVTCLSARYCVAGGDHGFFVRNAATWSTGIHAARLLWFVQVSCLSRSACFGSQDNQADVWDYVFDGARVSWSDEEIYGPKMSCGSGVCVGVSLDSVEYGRPIER